MKLLLNENIGRSAAEALRGLGHDAVLIGEAFAGTTDSAVLDKARDEGRVLVTKDERPKNTLRVLEGILERLNDYHPPFFVVASDTEFRVR